MRESAGEPEDLRRARKPNKKLKLVSSKFFVDAISSKRDHSRTYLQFDLVFLTISDQDQDVSFLYILLFHVCQIKILPFTFS